jgi:hypothetical protein
MRVFLIPKEGRKEERKEGRKEERKEGQNKAGRNDELVIKETKSKEQKFETIG